MGETEGNEVTEHDCTENLWLCHTQEVPNEDGQTDAVRHRGVNKFRRQHASPCGYWGEMYESTDEWIESELYGRSMR